MKFHFFRDLCSNLFSALPPRQRGGLLQRKIIIKHLKLTPCNYQIIIYLAPALGLARGLRPPRFQRFRWRWGGSEGTGRLWRLQEALGGSRRLCEALEGSKRLWAAPGGSGSPDFRVQRLWSSRRLWLLEAPEALGGSTRFQEAPGGSGRLQEAVGGSRGSESSRRLREVPGGLPEALGGPRRLRGPRFRGPIK